MKFCVNTLDFERHLPPAPLPERKGSKGKNRIGFLGGGPLCGWWGVEGCVEEGAHGMRGGVGTTRAGEGGFARFAPKAHKAPSRPASDFLPHFFVVKKVGRRRQIKVKEMRDSLTNQKNSDHQKLNLIFVLVNTTKI